MRSRLTPWLMPALLLAIPSLARADYQPDYTKSNWPTQIIDRPLTLDTGMTEFQGEVELNASESAFAKPMSVGPDIYYGLTDQLTFGLIHPIGICVSGEEKGCASVYDDVGLEALFYVLNKGSFHLALDGVLLARSLDPFALTLGVGAIARHRSGSMAIVVSPMVGFGMTERETNSDTLAVPLELQLQATKQIAFMVMTGVSGHLDMFGDTAVIPLGAGLVFAPSSAFDASARFAVANLILNPYDPLAGRGDLRHLQLALNLRF